MLPFYFDPHCGIAIALRTEHHALKSIFRCEIEKIPAGVAAGSTREKGNGNRREQGGRIEAVKQWENMNTA
jgi:hypothetical protein